MFATKKVGYISQYNSFKSFLKIFFNIKFFIRIWILFISLFLVLGIFFVLANKTKILLKKFSIFALQIASDTIWEKPVKDEFWQINFLVLGCWWEDWPWWWLTDTIMIASYNPTLQTVTFLSIPRDLYIENKETGYKWKINWLFASVYLKNKDKLWQHAAMDLAAKVLERQIYQITDVNIDKYVIITFKWFVDFINTLWGIDIYVPYTLIDTKYPTYNWWRTTIKFEKWWHHLNWRDALIYARSRHSTSDFSRAQRQQQIIKAVIKKLVSTDTFLSINKIKQLYTKYKEMVYTNLSFKEILWLAGYLNKIKHFFSFVYTADCDWTSWKTVTPWCLLYYPSRDLFNWLSVLLPIWATPQNVDYYENMKKFAFVVIYNQWFLLENPKIEIDNWVNKKLLYKKYGYYYPIASKFAKKLRVYAFNIVDVKNTKKFYTWTLIVTNQKRFSNTINLLPLFINDFKVYNKALGSGAVDMKIILGDNILY